MTYMLPTNDDGSDIRTDIRQLYDLIRSMGSEISNINKSLVRLETQQEFGSRLPCSKCLELQTEVDKVKSILEEIRLARASYSGGIKVSLWLAASVGGLISSVFVTVAPILLAKM